MSETMPAQTEIKNERVIRIGPDQVTITDREVVIESRHEMPEWKVSAMNAPAIYFDDKKYFLKEIGEAKPPYAFRYVLQPWPEGKIANAKMFHTYNAEAVAERDADRHGETLNGIMWVCLLPCYPLLGLFWSRTQQRFLRFGYVSRTITGLSIFTTFGLLLTEGSFIALLLQASARSGNMMIGGIIRAMVGRNYLALGPVSVPVGLFDVLLVLMLVADLCIRYTCYLREDQWTGGFLEWLVPKSERKDS
jgi:hypothetical protein